MGNGFNMIFRPYDGAPDPAMPNPITSGPTPPAAPGNENVLELNLTQETLAFTGAIGNVVNRGLQTQKDIALNGVGYTQSINDMTNPATGLANAPGPPVHIHFEPGLWMHAPRPAPTLLAYLRL